MNLRNLIRTGVLLLFLCSTLFLVVGVQDIFNSPDERANFVFTVEFIESGKLFLTESLNPQVGGVIHPRSVLAFEDQLLPTSFLGLPIVYGLIGKVFGVSIIEFLTPILAVLAVIAWWFVARRLFKCETLADLSALFLMIHPAFWLYTGRTMMHNVAFVALLIFAAYFLFVPEKLRTWNFVASGVMVALALAFRSAEIIWIGALVVGAVYFIYRNYSWKQIAIFLASLLIVASSFLLANKLVFGGYLETGYTLHDQAYAFEFSDPVEDIQNAPDGILGYVFPFGIHELAILRHVYWYGFALFPWMTGLSFIGMMFVLTRWKKIEPEWKWLLTITIGLAAWLAVVYGSWTFSDNPNADIVTLGNSYVRYWLPLFVLDSIFAARGLLDLKSLIKHKRLSQILAGLIIVAMGVLSMRLVFFGNDGFVDTRRALFEFQDKREQILYSTESDSIIIVDRSDKYLYPDRKVVVPLRSEQTYASIPVLVGSAPLYYFGITLPEADLEFLQESLVPGYSLSIIKTIGNESLYKITEIEL